MMPELKHWLDTFRSVKLFDAKDVLTASLFAKVQAIATAYFPELEDKIKALDTARSHTRDGCSRRC